MIKDIIKKQEEIDNIKKHNKTTKIQEIEIELNLLQEENQRL